MHSGNEPQGLATSGHTTPQSCSPCRQSPSQGEDKFWDDVNACRSSVTQREMAKAVIAESIRMLSSEKLRKLNILKIVFLRENDYHFPNRFNAGYIKEGATRFHRREILSKRKIAEVVKREKSPKYKWKCEKSSKWLSYVYSRQSSGRQELGRAP